MGLPPVAPPTARFLLRLFLIPASIVVVGVVAAYLLQLTFGWLVGSPRTPEQFLAKLDDNNPEVRWRAAAELSQVLPLDDHLAANTDFALKLTNRLQKTHDDAQKAERELSVKFPPVTATALEQMDDSAWLKRESALEHESKPLQPERTYVQFLTASLGRFMVPVGVPVLRELALQESGMEAEQLAEQRRRAVLALAFLGESGNRFDSKLTAAEQQYVLDQLSQAERDPQYAESARAARLYLEDRTKKIPNALGVDEILAKCAHDQDPYLRELSAFALNFWFGDAAANERIEKTLDELAHDRGQGTLSVAQLRQKAKRSVQTDLPLKTISYTVPPELTIQFNATGALARRGSTRVRMGRLAEMLDEAHLRTVFLREDANRENPSTDEAAVVETILNALGAVHELNARRPELISSTLRAAVEALQTNPNATVQKAASEALITTGR